MIWTEDSLEPVSIEQVGKYIDNQFFMRVATISLNGKPHNIPSNFIRFGEKIYFDADAASVKIKNIKRNGKVSLVWNSGKPFFDSRGVVVQGIARVIEDPELQWKVYDAINEKSFAGLRASYTFYHRQPFPRVKIEIQPEKVFSFHFEKGKALRGMNLK
ncbi:MAG TPA: pyridoxamine 5'-phosphate oxidase family protein [Nitrososphaerales archaeon]|nr:pyridoxamine 5'-phosphate oxidase family protein [Nitrososphaerales archaeon]